MLQNWAVVAAQLIQSRIEDTLKRKGECSIMLTGGRSAERLYREWAGMERLAAAKGLRFYFGDERCVPVDQVQSNYGMAIRTLFSKCLAVHAESIYRMEADAVDVNEAARRYDEVLPTSIDVMLLGVGEDGHIASLFPQSPVLHEQHRRVVYVDCPKAPNKRLTITPPVIAHASSIFVLATGQEKAKILQYAQRDPSDFISLPARLVLHAYWLLDSV
jgi:6-phosphogluconolactonase